MLQTSSQQPEPITARSLPDLYWGKARQDENVWKAHLLTYHCLDVAAVAETVLKANQRLLRTLSTLLRIDCEHAVSVIPFLVALHDIGKFAETFQNLVPPLLENLQGRSSGKRYSVRHDTLGFVLWSSTLCKTLTKPGGGSSPFTNRVSSLDMLMRATTGHHGLPPFVGSKRVRGASVSSTSILLPEHFAAGDEQAAIKHAGLVSSLLLKDPSQFETLSQLSEVAASRASWLLAGLAVLSDWIASNQSYFPYLQHQIPAQDYFAQAQVQASVAARATGVLPSRPAQAKCFRELFPDKEPSPLQKWCNDVEIPNEPCITLIEDVTGAGKTEAALLLAQRLNASSVTSGFYFALPTMATANAMYDRVAPFYRQLFDAADSPSFVLAHGSRNMNDRFAASKSHSCCTVYGDGTINASAYCNAWIGDNAKKALLADAGVGTIDQALCAALPLRHQSLRLLGLVGKVLLIDEVHACDTYMHRLLCTLIQAHARAGGSLILLSATLPLKQRQDLMTAFASGLDCQRPELLRTKHDDYPLVSMMSKSDLKEAVVGTRDCVRRHVNVALTNDIEEVVRIVEDATKKGQSVCWIRNTVRDALDAYTALRARVPADKLHLFHSRYVLADRMAIENKVMHDFGPQSSGVQRAGRVLVSTQVVEQSLDLDFDVIISDLAPIDLIIQRAGRLQRHTRDASGNRSSSDSRGVPQLYIYGPIAEDTARADWYRSVFPRAAYVYEDHGQLWLTARILQDMKGFAMPEDARKLIEYVYSQDSEMLLPEGLEGQSIKASGQRLADSAQAQLNVIKFDLGYSGEGNANWWEDATPTRLGEPTVEVCLAILENGILQPFYVNDSYPIQMSSLRLRAQLIEEMMLPIGCSDEMIESFKVAFDVYSNNLVAPMVPDGKGRWSCRYQDKKGKQHVSVYTPQTGWMFDTDLEEQE